MNSVLPKSDELKFPQLITKASVDFCTTNVTKPCLGTKAAWQLGNVPLSQSTIVTARTPEEGQ